VRTLSYNANDEGDYWAGESGGGISKYKT